MSKYHPLWLYLQKKQMTSLVLTFDEIQEIAGCSLDHSFLQAKKELKEFGYRVEKISMKNHTVQFVKEEPCPKE